MTASATKACSGRSSPRIGAEVHAVREKSSSGRRAAEVTKKKAPGGAGRRADAQEAAAAAAGAAAGAAEKAKRADAAVRLLAAAATTTVASAAAAAAAAGGGRACGAGERAANSDHLLLVEAPHSPELVAVDLATSRKMRATSIEVGLATPPLAPKTNRHANSGHTTNTKTTTTTKYSLGNKKNNLGWNNGEDDDDDDDEEEEEAKETGCFTSARDPARRSRSRGCSSSTTCSTSSSSADSVRNDSDDIRRLHVCTEHTTAASCDGGKKSDTATSTSPSSAACTPAGAPCTSPSFVHGSKLSPPPKKSSTTLSTSSKRQRRPEQEAQEIDLVARALWALASVRGAQRGEAIMARLDCSRVPGMELGKYLKRVLRSLNKNDVETVSRDNVLQMSFTVGFRLLGSALVLIDRLIARTSHRDAPLLVSHLNAHRLMLCCMMLVSKFSEDEPLNNAFWASAGGMPLAELNECELILFKLLDFETRVAEEDFVLLLQRLGIVI